MNGKHKLKDTPDHTTEAKKGKNEVEEKTQATPSPSNLKVYPRRSRTPSAKSVDCLVDESIERERSSSAKTSAAATPNKSKTTPKRKTFKKATAAMRSKALLDNNVSPVSVQLSPLKKPPPLSPEEKKNKPASSLLDFKRPIVSKKLPAPLTPDKLQDNKKEAAPTDMEVDTVPVSDIKTNTSTATSSDKDSDKLPTLGTITQKTTTDIDVKTETTTTSANRSVLSIIEKLPSLRPITIANEQKNPIVTGGVEVNQVLTVPDQQTTAIDLTQSTANVVELLTTTQIANSSNIEQQLQQQQLQLQNIPILENGNKIHVIPDKIILAADLGDGSGTNYLITIDPATQAILEREGKLVVVSKVVDNDSSKGGGTSISSLIETPSSRLETVQEQKTVHEPYLSTRIVSILSSEETKTLISENSSKTSSSISSDAITPNSDSLTSLNVINIEKPDTTINTNVQDSSDSTTNTCSNLSSDTVSEMKTNIHQPHKTIAQEAVSTMQAISQTSSKNTAQDLDSTTKTIMDQPSDTVAQISVSVVQAICNTPSKTIAQDLDSTTQAIINAHSKTIAQVSDSTAQAISNAHRKTIAQVSDSTAQAISNAPIKRIAQDSDSTTPANINAPSKTIAQVSDSTAQAISNIFSKIIAQDSDSTTPANINAPSKIIAQDSDSTIKTNQSSGTISQEPDTTTKSRISSSEADIPKIHSSKETLQGPSSEDKPLKAVISTEVPPSSKRINADDPSLNAPSQANIQEADSIMPSETNTQLSSHQDNQTNTNDIITLKSDSDLKSSEVNGSKHDTSSTSTDESLTLKDCIALSLPTKQDVVVNTTKISTAEKPNEDSPISDDNIILLESDLICLADDDSDSATVVDVNKKDVNKNDSHQQEDLRIEQGIVIPTEIDLFEGKTNPPGDSYKSTTEKVVATTGRVDTDAATDSKISKITVVVPDIEMKDS